MINIIILENIIKYITDTNSYLNFRSTNFIVNELMKNLYIFEDFKIIKKVEVSPNKIIIHNLNNKILEKFIFYNYGKYKYEKGSTTITNIVPNKIKYSNIENNVKINREYDIKKNKSIETKRPLFPYPGCEIM